MPKSNVVAIIHGVLCGDPFFSLGCSPLYTVTADIRLAAGSSSVLSTSTWTRSMGTVLTVSPLATTRG